MKERPIIFNSEMVKAILEGSKTQTRRPMEIQPGKGEYYQDMDNGCYAYISTGGMSGDYVCPFGKVGDRLWVRETAYIAPKHFDYGEGNCLDNENCERIVGYCASMSLESERCAKDYGIKKTPSIHMPRWASRITLEITVIRVERVQDITWQDCVKEGFLGDMPMIDSKHWFEKLWNSIYSKKYPWESNPWVWIIEFKKIEAQNERTR
jgi:hypothetical protein